MATRRWLGAALAVAQVETLTVANTWAANDTGTVTINGRDITITVGTTATTTQIATELAAVLNSSSSTLGTGYSANERGPNVAEFKEFTAAASGSTVVLTGSTKGKPFTVTASESTAGTGTLTTATTTAATGPNHFNNADNWSGGAIPVDSDAVVFDSGEVDCLYGLDQSAVSPETVDITMGYTGNIGLPKTNVDNASYPYPEYRSQFLALGVSTDAVTTDITIGQGSGAGSQRIKLDSGSGQAVLLVLNTGQAESDAAPTVEWKGTHASNVATISKGNVGIAFTAGETAVVATLNVGYQTNISGDSRVYCGSGVTLTTVNISGGVLTTNSAMTTVNQTDGELIHYAGAVTTINLDKGAIRYRSTGTLTTAVVGSNGNLDFRQDMRSRTVTNCDLYEDAELHDPFGTATFTNGIDLNRCTPNDVILDLQHNKRITLGAVA